MPAQPNSKRSTQGYLGYNADMAKRLISLFLAILILTACQDAAPSALGGLKVLAVETFLADIVQNVAGDRLKVDALIPAGLDPHAFEPAPRDVAHISESRVLILNGAGLEEWLAPVLANTSGQRLVIEASAGLQSRTAREGEQVEGAEGSLSDHGDPHFWLDPINTIHYVEVIRDGLIQADPAGKDTYARNAAVYIEKLRDLDVWIRQQVSAIPEERRLLVTNHESLGYFADRYGFKIVGTLLPSISTSASPSAQQLARLVDQIRATQAKAIFLETGSNPQLARQVAEETGVRVVTDIYTHSITAAGGKAPTYLDMMRANTEAIVGALK